jgi:hypothetical protein
MLLVITSALAALAQKDATSKEHFERGMVFFNLQDFPSAVTEFKAAYTADPSKADYLYMIGQAQRFSGECVAAIASYRAYMRGVPPTSKASAAAEGFVHLCENELAKLKAEKLAAEKLAAEKLATEKAAADKAAEKERAAPDLKGRDPAVAVLPPSSVSTVEERHWYTDGPGLGLLIPGVLGTGAGTVFLVLGNKDVGSAKTAAQVPTLAARDALVTAGQLKQTIGVIALSAGGALLVGGVIRSVVVGRSTATPVVTVVPLPGGAAAMLSGAF